MLGAEIRLVALDLDGTFLDDQHRVPAANARAVVTLLQVAGHSFLMDNASEDLKRLGFRIAPRNDADGVARIVGEYWS